MSRHLPLCGDCNCFGCGDTDFYIKKDEATKMTDGLDIYNAIQDKMSFEEWYYKPTGFSQVLRVGSEALQVEVLDKSADQDTNNYGEAYQGWTGNSYIIFGVDDATDSPPRFFKKSGIVDSYYGVHWDGKFQEVKMTQKTVTVYDYE